MATALENDRWHILCRSGLAKARHDTKKEPARHSSGPLHRYRCQAAEPIAPADVATAMAERERIPVRYRPLDIIPAAVTLTLWAAPTRHAGESRYPRLARSRLEKDVVTGFRRHDGGARSIGQALRQSV